MHSLGPNHRLALGFAVAISSLQLGRTILWGRWPEPLEWFIFVDAYLVSALLLWGVALSRRQAPAARPVLAAGWGFACGILFRSFFGQLEDPSRHAGHEIVVIVIKGALLTVAVAGLIGSIRSEPPSSS
jgi:hypothetical protein